NEHGCARLWTSQGQQTLPCSRGLSGADCALRPGSTGTDRFSAAALGSSAMAASCCLFTVDEDNARAAALFPIRPTLCWRHALRHVFAGLVRSSGDPEQSLHGGVGPDAMETALPRIGYHASHEQF